MLKRIKCCCERLRWSKVGGIISTESKLLTELFCKASMHFVIILRVLRSALNGELIHYRVTVPIKRKASWAQTWGVLLDAGPVLNPFINAKGFCEYSHPWQVLQRVSMTCYQISSFYKNEILNIFVFSVFCDFYLWLYLFYLGISYWG